MLQYSTRADRGARCHFSERSQKNCPINATMVETEYCQDWQFQYNFPNHSISSTPDAIHGKETAPRDLFVVLRLKDGR